MARYEDRPTEGFGYRGSSGSHRGGEHSGSGRGWRGRDSRGRGGSSGYPGRGGSKFYKASYSDDAKENVDKLFNKKYKFECSVHEEWVLPHHTSMFQTREVLIPELEELKEKLNTARDQLDTTEPLSWRKHTNFTNRAGSLVGGLSREYQTEMCTMNWAKMHEILWSFEIISKSAVKYNSVHLCEAPGAFVTSLNHFLKTHRTDCVWKWIAITLNPYHEGNSLTPYSDQDLLMSESKSCWFVGPDNTGDITHWENVVALKEAIKKDMKDSHMVTADGGLSSFSDPNRQEEQLSKLLYCEVVCGLLLLAKEGTLIAKTFTIFEPQTISLLYLLTCCFEEVNFFKAVTSKATNSEHYLVCRRYKGRPAVSKKHWEHLINHYGEDVSATTLFPMESIPKSFISEVIKCAKEFTNYQVKAIETNLDLYDCMTFSEKKQILEERDLTCDKYKTKCYLKKLSRDKAIVPTMLLDGSRLTVVPVVRSDDIVREWLERRSVDSFLAHISHRKQNSDRGSVSDGVPEAKVARISLDPDAALAVKQVLSAVWFDGSKVADKSGVTSMEMEPIDVQWLRSSTSSTYDITKDIQSLEGAKIAKVVNSRFCHNDIVKSLSTTLVQSQIMDSGHVDEHTHISNHMTPGHALLAQDPPFFLTKDGVNFAALDYMTGIVRKSSEVLLFMDLAGAPSGFSHYIYWRRQSLAKGWGLVRVEHPILGPGSVIERLAPWETFQVLGPHNGVDICDSTTIRSLCAGVENYCPDGVHLVVGDVPDVAFGAHSPGEAELLVNQHLLTQFVCALKILGKGGVFVCRCYGLLTRFSAGILFLMYKLFREVTVIKPFTSSPTSSERFIVCRGYHGCKAEVTDKLLDINGAVSALRDEVNEKGVAILEIVPMQVLLEETFHRYLTQSNERVAKYQAKMIQNLEQAFQSPEHLPSVESQQLLCKGTMEILELPAIPTFIS
ncbi:cap-specific mRNA (nucleoside-2'-O-)-methyltransferase 2-like [Halichondria panicea]|uniref:cap-specific mRNA (nucleoside-2'-O-)-methyltransferase 2-like n=1 Tax=Halichondria panicea TaxID=6063 RepID=UPI00312B5640